MPGASGCALSLVGILRRLRQRAAEHAFDLLARQAAGAQQHRRLEAADDGGFDADRDRRRRRRSGRSAPRDRSARGPPWSARHDPTDWPMAPPPARRTRAGSPRATGCAGIRIATVSSPAVARSATAQSAVFGSTSVSGPGQNASASAVAWASKRRDLPRGGEIADMGDQRIEGRPALGLVEPGDRRRVGGIGAEAIDGLGRERDQPALGQAARRRGHGGLAGGQNLRFQVQHSLGLTSSIRLLAVCRNPRL